MKGVGTEPAYLVNTPTEHYVYEEPDEFRDSVERREQRLSRRPGR